MNIYEKLQSCKSELQKLNLPKTGKNNFAKYDYWELSDFLPTIVSLFENHKMCSICTFNADIATLRIINSEKPDETIELTSPMAAADLKGCHAIQNMGAVETYQRRYLYMSALDISEPDALDATQGAPQRPVVKDTPKNDSKKPSPKEEPPEIMCTANEINMLHKEIQRVGGDETEWVEYVAKKAEHGPKPKKFEDITKKQFIWSMKILNAKPTKAET
jgi:hypothetical protein